MPTIGAWGCCFLNNNGQVTCLSRDQINLMDGGRWLHSCTANEGRAIDSLWRKGRRAIFFRDLETVRDIYARKRFQEIPFHSKLREFVRVLRPNRDLHEVTFL